MAGIMRAVVGNNSYGVSIVDSIVKVVTGSLTEMIVSRAQHS